MSLYRLLARYVMAPTFDLLRNTHTVRCLRDLEESQHWPLERILALQSKRLQRLVQHACTNVPHYREVMNERGLSPMDIRSAADLAALPVLTRSFAQQHREELLAEGFPRNRLRQSTTSGSTGMPLRFYSSREDQRDHGFARSIRAMSWAGLLLGDRIAMISRPRQHDNRLDHVMRTVAARMQRWLPVPVGTLSDAELPGIVRRLAESRLDGIRAYPSAMALIAGFIRDTGTPVPLVRSIVTGGAELLGNERSIIREVFGTEPYSNYSSYEAFEIACECRAHAGLHISAEDLVLEVVDDAGLPVPAGVEGRIVVTNLHNYAMPFIRYDMGDAGRLLEHTCPCGMELPRLDTLIGRKNRSFVTSTGKRVFFEALFLDQLARRGIRQYQIVQETLDAVLLRLVPDRGLTTVEEKERIARSATEMLKPKLGPGISLSVEFVEHIEPSEAGKHVFVLSRVAEQLAQSEAQDS